MNPETEIVTRHLFNHEYLKLVVDKLPTKSIKLHVFYTNDGKYPLSFEVAKDGEVAFLTSNPYGPRIDGKVAYLKKNHWSKRSVSSFINCKHCKKDDIFRFKCLQCENFQICWDCESQSIHQEHHMIREKFEMPFIYYDGKEWVEVSVWVKTHIRGQTNSIIETEETIPKDYNTFKSFLKEKFLRLKEPYAVRYRGKCNKGFEVNWFSLILTL